MQAYRDMVAQRRMQQPDNVSAGGINLDNEIQTEMNDESGTDFGDIFHQLLTVRRAQNSVKYTLAPT